jgi:aminomethyltransferase
MYSPLVKKSMAIGRIDMAFAVHGTQLEVRGKQLNAKAMAHNLPFDDPKKTKRTAKG